MFCPKCSSRPFPQPWLSSLDFPVGATGDLPAGQSSGLHLLFNFPEGAGRPLLLLEHTPRLSARLCTYSRVHGGRCPSHWSGLPDSTANHLISAARALPAYLSAAGLRNRQQKQPWWTLQRKEARFQPGEESHYNGIHWLPDARSTPRNRRHLLCAVAIPEGTCLELEEVFMASWHCFILP